MFSVWRGRWDPAPSLEKQTKGDITVTGFLDQQPRNRNVQFDLFQANNCFIQVKESSILLSLEVWE
ncbi:hypothetical protein J6590_021422, partial [Homalodisca vitripennis]